MQISGGCGSPLFHLACSGILRTPGGFDQTTNIDEVVVATVGHIVKAAFRFG